jgi:hypothetical protein
MQPRIKKPAERKQNGVVPQRSEERCHFGYRSGSQYQPIAFPLQPNKAAPNDQDQRGEPDGLDGGTAIVEASAASTCWATAIIRLYRRSDIHHEMDPKINQAINKLTPLPTINDADILPCK